MAITWGEMGCLTWDEPSKMQLSYDDLKDLDFPSLVRLAQAKVERFQDLPAEKRVGLEKAMPWIQAFLTSLAAAEVVELLKAVDLSDLLCQLIALLS